MAHVADIGMKAECPALFWEVWPDDDDTGDEELELKDPAALELLPVIEAKLTVGNFDTVCHVPPDVVVLGL